MKYLLELKEEDIFPSTKEYSVDNTWENRVTVKVILLNPEEKISLVGIRYLLLPGGGVEVNETLEEAVIRECWEEVGYNVKVLKEIGITREFRLKLKRKQETHCFLAKVVGGRGIPQTTQEDEQNMKVEWFDPDEALKLLKKQKETISSLSYNSQFNVRTHIVFLEKFISENL